MAEGLKQKTVRGLIWSGVERLFGQIFSFVLAIFLARLLTPEDYGVIAIVTIFISVSGLFVDAGFANALVRKTDCTDIDRSTVLYFNIVVSIFMYAILYVCAPFIAELYHNFELINLIRCTSLVIILNSFGIVQQSILTSRLDFKKLTPITIFTSFVSGCIGIFLAYNNYGVWALVMQYISAAVMRNILLCVIVRWRPLYIFSYESFKDLFGYSYRLMLSNLIIKGGNESIQLLMGKFFSVSNLGYYNYSKRIADFASMNISTAIQRVLFPAFSQVQHDNNKLLLAYQKSLILSMTFIFPLMLIISTLSEPLVNILLTNEWMPIIPILRITTLTMAFWPLLLFNINLLWVKKRSDLSFRLEVVGIAIKLLIVLSLFNFGLFEICIGFLVATIVNFIVYAYFTSRIIHYGVFAQVSDVIKVFIKPCLSSIFTYYFVLPMLNDNISKLVVGSIIITTITILQIIVFRGLEYQFLIYNYKHKK